MVERFVVSVIALAALFGSSTLPAVASACSCAPSSLDSSLRDGQDVPVDVAPVITGFWNAASVTWSSLDGVPVSFELRHGRGLPQCMGGIGELRARTALAPHTTYVIGAHTSGGRREELRFTTGSSRVPEQPLPAPALTVTLVHRLIYDSCVSDVNGCLAVGDVDTEVILRDVQGRELDWFITRGAHNLERIAGEPACVEARTRNAAGHRSEPVTLCGAELPIRAAQASDYEDYWLRCDGGRLPPPGAEVDPGQVSERDAEVDAGQLSDADAGHVSESDAEVELSPSELPRLADADGCSASTPGRGTLWPLLLVLLFRARRRIR